MIYATIIFSSASREFDHGQSCQPGAAAFSSCKSCKTQQEEGLCSMQTATLRSASVQVCDVDPSTQETRGAHGSAGRARATSGDLVFVCRAPAAGKRRHPSTHPHYVAWLLV